MKAYVVNEYNEHGDNMTYLHFTWRGARKHFEKLVRESIGDLLNKYTTLENFEKDTGMTKTDDYFDNNEGYVIDITRAIVKW